MEDLLELASQSYEELNETRANISSLDTNMQEIAENIKQLESKGEDSSISQAEIEKSQIKIDELKKSEIQVASKFSVHMDAWQTAIAKELGIDRQSINFSEPYTTWDPKLQERFSGNLADIANKLSELQKSLGEKGNILESPKTIEKLKEKDIEHGGNGMKILMVLFIIGGVAGIVGVIDKFDAGLFHQYLMKNPNLADNIPVGCYQIHKKSGTIRTIGVCGIQDKCQNLSQTDCGNVPGGICAWNGGSCSASNNIVSAMTCCTTCKGDSDCKNPNASACQTNADCLTGTCEGGICQTQTCDLNQQMCTPCPGIDPSYSIRQQTLDGKLAFCLGTSPVTTCGNAGQICQIYNPDDGTGGACIACDANDSNCTNPGGNIQTKSTCMCSGNDWVNLSLCASAPDLAMALEYMNSISDEWAPMKTPTIVYILGGLSIILILITLIWYVRYLIKNAKK